MPRLCCLFALCTAVVMPPVQAQAPPRTAAQQKPPAKPAPAQTPGRTTSSANPARASTAPASRVELELTGVTSLTSDTALARGRVERKTSASDLKLRAGYTLTSNKSYGKNARDLTTRTLLLDSRYALGQGSSFWTLTGATNMRMRSEASTRYPKKTGYLLFAAGRGTRLQQNLEGDIGLGLLTSYDVDGRETDPALTGRLLARYPLGKRLTFDSTATLMLPLGNGLRLDSDLTLNYRLTQELYLRLGWSANNLVVPVLGAGDWDTTTRISFLYRK